MKTASQEPMFDGADLREALINSVVLNLTDKTPEEHLEQLLDEAFEEGCGKGFRRWISGWLRSWLRSWCDIMTSEDLKVWP